MGGSGPKSVSKQQRRVVGDPISQDEVASAGQLVSERPVGDEFVRSSSLALEESTGFGLESPGKLRRFREGPGEIGVAVLAIALALLALVAAPFGGYQPAVGGVVADRAEAGDLSGVPSARPVSR